mgnify:CR=1 FL=1
MRVRGLVRRTLGNHGVVLKSDQPQTIHGALPGVIKREKREYIQGRERLVLF